MSFNSIVDHRDEINRYACYGFDCSFNSIVDHPSQTPITPAPADWGSFNSIVDHPEVFSRNIYSKGFNFQFYSRSSHGGTSFTAPGTAYAFNSIVDHHCGCLLNIVYDGIENFQFYSRSSTLLELGAGKGGVPVFQFYSRSSYIRQEEMS